MKKILLVNRSLGNGGIERVTLSLAKKLVENGYEVHFIIFSNVIKHDIPSNIKVHYVRNFLSNPLSIISRGINKIYPFITTNMISRYYKIMFLNYLNRLEKEYGNFDKIFLNGLGAYSCLYTIECNRFIYVSHNTKTEIINKLAKNNWHKNFILSLLKKMLNNRTVITVSHGIEKDWLNNIKINPKEIQTIYNPIDFEYIIDNSHEKFELKNKYIINVGRFVPEKRHDLLLKSFSLIKNKEIMLVLLGVGNDIKSLKESIEKLNLSDRVTLVPFDKNPYKWIKNAKLLVLSSDHEGLPTVLIESLVCGTTVVSTDCPSGPSEILEGKLSNYLVPVNNVNALTEKINYALENPMQKNAYIEHIEKFNSKNIIDQYIGIIES